MTDPTPRSRNRVSRYQRAQERRESQRRADQRFYNGIFGIIGACVLVVLGLAMIASSGNAPEISGTGETLVRTTFLGLTALEIGGLVVVAIIAFIMWRRIKRR
ncbi:hypothetical protein GCM10007853_11360 [Algimonas ampicilliniresistens]|jgi:L-serine deaminase|uniref:DUF3955 domain-containing protein n=1 Tax=Algimonas ampicilliniresistens TaxID=1298735 RepID=A0ABQ5V882_9PROT|nr:hypothetical protein [Algimonas ampicilliniresistens]GLQ23262.1 hypothetical protein GCM10007853_11360 [Algimonas ampicilliniresistens]